MSTITRNWALVAANILIPIAILIFAIGFFPYKPFLPGLAQYDQASVDSQPNAPFDKVIFMVVDALRSDFVYTTGTGFGFVQSLIRDGAAMPFTAHATSPTITMPRIKAITTGSTPSFLDLILNFAESDTTSSLATQDTWLAQMKAKNTGKMVMYGDDTWLKLFPDIFDRADGTSSFFVADFTEVDNNVTRHISQELGKSDWSTMVLHYLGLDHIGHKTGPRSPFMIPKQAEMDDIVQTMYKAIEGEKHLSNTLLVLAGDHGMNDAGNHGGSAAGETSPALVFASPKLKSILKGQKSPVSTVEDFQYYSTIEQSDIAPTLAGLLGFPIPKNNLGAFITNFLPLWSHNDGLQLMLQNVRQMLSIVAAASSKSLFEGSNAALACVGSLSVTESLACDWHDINRLRSKSTLSEEDTRHLISLTSKWCKSAQTLMSGAASNYDMTKLVFGLVLSACALIFAVIAAWPTLSPKPLASLPFAIICVLYAALMFASSFVEEEHHFWYWLTSGWFLFLFAKGVIRYKRGKSMNALSAIVALAALRICRRWNQTGQKFAGEPDIARTFLTENTMLLWILVTATYALTAIMLARDGFPSLHRFQASAFALALFLLAMNFKIAFTIEDAPELMKGVDPLSLSMLSKYSGHLDLTSSARIVFVAIGGSIIYTLLALLIGPPPTALFYKGSLASVIHLTTFLLLTQSRTTSVPLFLLFQVIIATLQAQRLTLLNLAITQTLLSQTSYFTLGLSNAISSIDLSLAYNGVSGYNAPLVGFLCFISNFAGPIYFTLTFTPLILDYYARQRNLVVRHYPKLLQTALRKKLDKIKRAIWNQNFALQTVFITSHLVAIMGACMVLRTHLFIWTVFSPKFLFSITWGLGVHFLVNFAFAAVAWAAGNGGTP